MNPKEILERLEKAKELISTFPENVRILTVGIDGLGRIAGKDNSYIHLADPIQLLADAGVIEAGSWTTEDDPEREVLEDNILLNGFSVLTLRDRKKAAPGDSSTGDGGTAQSATVDTPIIGA